MTACAFGESAKQASENVIRIDGTPVFISGEFRKILATLSRLFAASVNRQFKFQKCSQLFICVHNVPLSVVAVCVRNPDRSPVGINRSDVAQAPTGLAEIASDYFPIVHPVSGNRTHDY